MSFSDNRHFTECSLNIDEGPIFAKVREWADSDEFVEPSIDNQEMLSQLTEQAGVVLGKLAVSMAVAGCSERDFLRIVAVLGGSGSKLLNHAQAGLKAASNNT